MDDVAIRVDSVSKEFKLPHEKHGSFKNVILNAFRGSRTYERQQVLKNVSIDIKKGDFFGIVGRNGSGKSTLLKLLAGVYSPTKGHIHVNGKLTPFIELGVGFNPELTGRDNVFLNGALLGFSQKEMEKMYDGIVEFAELEKFMDQKLKNYSSGMQVRLAFSIAIKAQSDVLIFDEVLAVGDEAFQRKCLDTFEQYKANKQTVVLVTHDMDTVRKFCNRAMLINDGEIAEIGNPQAVAARYSQLNQKIINKDVAKSNENRSGSKYIKANILGGDLKPKQSFDVGDQMLVEVDWSNLKADDFESIGISIFKQSGEHITGINSRSSSHSPGWKEKGNIGLEFRLDLIPGKYHLLIEIFEEEGKVVDSLFEGPQFTIAKTKMKWSGLTELTHKWHEK